MDNTADAKNENWNLGDCGRDSDDVDSGCDGVMVDTNFGRRGSCEVTRVGYDSYVDGEWVERVDEVVYVGDCEGERDDEGAEPAGIVNWDGDYAFYTPDAS